MVQDEENLAVLQGLPLVYTSLEDAQKKDSWCKSVVEDLKKVGVNKHKFTVHNKLLCYYPKGAKARRYAVPELFRPMLIKYFHDSNFRPFGGIKNFEEIRAPVFWPQLKNEVFSMLNNVICVSG